MSTTHEGTVQCSCLGSTVVSPGWYRPAEHRGTFISQVLTAPHAPLPILIPVSLLNPKWCIQMRWEKRGKRQTQNNNSSSSRSTRLFPGVLSYCSVLRATRSTRLVMCWSRAATENRKGPTWHSTGSVAQFSKPGFLFFFLLALFVSARVKL